MCCLTGVCNVEYPHPADPGLSAQIVSVSADGVVLGLSGEVDISNQHELDAALTAMMATKARNAFIDASDCTFMSLQGYAAIGRCISELDSLTLRTCLGVAGRACTPARVRRRSLRPRPCPYLPRVKKRGEGP